jgi:hypothetical protein
MPRFGSQSVRVHLLTVHESVVVGTIGVLSCGRGRRVPRRLVDGKFRAITLLDSTTEVSGQVMIIRDPQIEICALEERRGHQRGNIFAVHGDISFNGPKVHVLSGCVNVSTQTRDEGLHRPHQQHIFDEERIEFRG